MDHSNRVIALCDSSKIGRFSYAKAGPVTMIGTLITDSGAPVDTVESLRNMGIEVVVAENEDR
jgi:DeoR/GlpR family transcriptional regulator of sugar metabolism